VFQVLEQVRLASGRSGKGLVDLIDPRPILGELRLRKDAEEVAYLRKASDLSKAAHLAAMQEARPGMMEYEIEARLDFEMRKRGSPRVGYPAIVAGGKNATCLHYRANNEPLRDGELLLIDAGGEFGYYTADITRTFPIGRNFTNEQALVYEWVLKAQKAALALCRPGETLPKIHETAIRTLIQGMLSLGWLKGDEESLYRSQAFKQFYPHGTGHFLGSEVHDAGLYLIDGKPRPLEAGMCFTVEPGLYVQPNDTSVPEKWRGIGIRIEDDLIITASAHENLTEGLPKEREEVEALRGKAIG
jgi:Xaa-Pro aminopeptidase